MPSDLAVSLTLKQRDEMSRPTERALQGVVKQSRDATASVNSVAEASAKTAAQRAQSSTQAERVVQRNLQETAAAYSAEERAAVAAQRAIDRAINQSIDARLRAQARFEEARRELGIRSENEIEREITRTQRAYQTLADAGTLSAREQSRAFDAMRTRVADLNAEMGRLSRSERSLQLGRRAGGLLMGAGEVALGGAAAAGVIAGPVNRAMAYDRSIALMANTAFNERNAAGRIRGEAELRDVVKKTIATGGGTPEEVVAAMTQLLGQNAISHESAFRLMPILQRYATATGSDTTELGDIAMRGIQNFGLREDQIPAALDAAVKGGHMGGFHLRQMSKWLPQQMAAAKNAGMSGMDGLTSLIALNEVSMTTAGSPDEAGNNVLDLLTHLNSQATAHQIRKELGATLSVRYANAIEHGQGPLEAFSDLIQQVMQKDKNYQIIQKKLATTTNDDERRGLYENMEQVLAGSAIGKVIRNRQELLGMMGYLNNRDRFREIKTASGRALGTAETDAQVMESTASFKTERAKSLAELGEFDALRGLDSAIGNTSDKLTQYAQQYPGLISAIMGAKIAFEEVAAVLGVVSMARFMMGHGSATRGAGQAAERAAEGGLLRRVLGAGVGESGVLARVLRPAGSAALSAMFGGIEAWQTGHDDTLSQREKDVRYTAIAGHAAGAGLGAWGGAAVGAGVGSIFPVIGTAAGGLIGGLVGGFGGDMLGDKLGKMIGDAIFRSESQKQAVPQPANVNVKVELDGRQLFESVQQIMLEESRRR